MNNLEFSENLNTYTTVSKDLDSEDNVESKKETDNLIKNFLKNDDEEVEMLLKGTEEDQDMDSSIVN